MLSTNQRILLLTTVFGALVGLSLWLSINSINHSNVYQEVLTLLPNGYSGVLLLFTILTIATSIGLPRQVAAFSAGFMLDVVSGALLATVAAVSGCLLTIFISRKLLSHFVRRKYPQQLTHVSTFFSQATFTKTLIIRFLPAGSNLLTNILAGVANVPLKPYILASGLGFIPQMLIFSMMGNGVKLADKQQLLLSMSLFVIAALLSGYLYKKSKHKNLIKK